jgi:glycerophosphoryl diester phosphodiesterase
MKTVAACCAVAAVFFGAWLFLIAPRLFRRPDFGPFKKYYYAHRGLYTADQAVPENSLAAFRRAAESGYGMELDLHLTRDGVVVVHHDENILRMCGADKNISELTFEQLRAYSLKESGEKIPSFEQVLTAVAGRTPIIVEVKAYKRYKELCRKALETLSGYGGLYCVESFNPYSVLWFRKHAPHVVRGQLMIPYNRPGYMHIKNGFEAWALRCMLTNCIVRPDFEAYILGGRRQPSLRLARRVFGMQEVSWTVRDALALERCAAEGCMVIFEDVRPAYEQEENMFKNEFYMTKSIVREYQAAVLMNRKGAKPYIILLAAMFAFGAYSLIAELFAGALSYISALLAVVPLLCFGSVALKVSVQAQQEYGRLRQIGAGNKVSYTVDEAVYVSNLSKAPRCETFNHIEKLIESKNLFILVLGPSAVLPIKKDAFTAGTAESFKTFITGKIKKD